MQGANEQRSWWHVLRRSGTWTDEERRTEAEKQRREWFHRTLDWIWFAALGDPELKETFVAKAKSLKVKLSPRSKSGMKWLLAHYAIAVEEHGDDRDAVLDNLIDKNRRIHGGVVIDRRTMNNLVSTAINEIPLQSLPEWARPAVQARAKRGQIIKKLRKK